MDESTSFYQSYSTSFGRFDSKNIVDKVRFCISDDFKEWVQKFISYK
jgi:hypothetical protein